MPLDQMRRYFELAAQGQAAAPQLQALLEAQERVLEERLQQMQRHLKYVGRKIAYWRAVAARDEQTASDILAQLTSGAPPPSNPSMASDSSLEE